MRALDNDLAKPGDPVTITSGSRLNNDPVAKALANIGGPALEPVGERLKNSSNSQVERRRAARILFFMNSVEADLVLALQFQREGDPEIKGLIEAQLKEHQKTKFH